MKSNYSAATAYRRSSSIGSPCPVSNRSIKQGYMSRNHQPNRTLPQSIDTDSSVLSLSAAVSTAFSPKYSQLLFETLNLRAALFFLSGIVFMFFLMSSY